MLEEMNQESKNNNAETSVGAYRRYTRREFLGKLAVTTGIAIGGYGLAVRDDHYSSSFSKVKKFMEHGDVEEKLDEMYPLSKKRAADEKIDDYHSAIGEALEGGFREEAESIMNSPEYVQIVRDVARGKVQEKKRDLMRPTIGRDFGLLGDGFKGFVAGIFYSGIGYIGLKGILDSIGEHLQENHHFQYYTDNRLPNPESQTLYLPPLGGKIPVTDEDEVRIYLEPTFTAEEQYEQIEQYKNSGTLGKLYVHQLTVQGRLPDEFKFAAIALILNSPYSNNWEQPFFNAPWGTVAPLIHDGGHVEVNKNYLWHEVAGRTDFLQRVSMVHLQDLSSLEHLSIEEITSMPTEKLQQARLEQMERDRVLLESKAYQRLALALHAKLGTAPKFIPRKIKTSLTSEWELFQAEMAQLLCEFDIHGVADVPWFLKEPRDLWDRWYEERYEADWEPIQEQLIKMEVVRRNHPEIRLRVSGILRARTGSIDKILGLS